MVPKWFSQSFDTALATLIAEGSVILHVYVAPAIYVELDSTRLRAEILAADAALPRNVFVAHSRRNVQETVDAFRIRPL